MSNDISTMYTKDQNQKTGRKGYYMWKREKQTSIRPSDYGDYIHNRYPIPWTTLHQIYVRSRL